MEVKGRKQCLRRLIGQRNRMRTMKQKLALTTKKQNKSVQESKRKGLEMKLLNLSSHSQRIRYLSYLIVGSQRMNLTRFSKT